jgi:hypothetical protein
MLDCPKQQSFKGRSGQHRCALPLSLMESAACCANVIANVVPVLHIGNELEFRRGRRWAFVWASSDRPPDKHNGMSTPNFLEWSNAVAPRHPRSDHVIESRNAHDQIGVLGPTELDEFRWNIVNQPQYSRQDGRVIRSSL